MEQNLTLFETINMDKYITFVLFASILTIATAIPKLDNYHWQDYNGVVPEDALLAGHGKNGQLIYIGQVSDDGKTIPGKIYENDPNVYYEFGEHAWAANTSAKIFCTDVSDNFEWVPTETHNVHKLREQKNVIDGGYQSNFLTFIGRIQLDGAIEVGKVICNEMRCLALYINNDDRYEEYDEFEILTYNPDNENIIKDA